MRDDDYVLRSLLVRLTSLPDLPVLIVGGEVIGSMDKIREMVKDRRLQKLIALSGALVKGGKTLKNRNH